MKRVVRRIINAAMGLGCGLAGLALNPAMAAVVMDQDHLIYYDETTLGVGGALFGAYVRPDGFKLETGMVQSFTASGGGYLDHLEFQLWRQTMWMPPIDGKVTLTLFDGDLAVGGANAVTSVVLEANSLPVWRQSPNGYLDELVSFNVRAANFFVTPGQRYSVRFDYLPYSEKGNYIYLANAWSKYGKTVWEEPLIIYNEYDGGELRFYSNLSSGFTQPLLGDSGFRSFIDKTPVSGAVPDPASWALLIVGFTAVGATLRARRTAALSGPNLRSICAQD